MSNKNIECGQVWKCNVKTDIYNLGDNDLVIILSKDKEYWKIGNFWWSGKPIMPGHKECGGARELELGDIEIKRNMTYVGHIKDLTL